MPASHSEVVVRIELVRSHEPSHSAWHTVRAQEMLAYLLAAVTNDVFLPKTPLLHAASPRMAPHIPNFAGPNVESTNFLLLPQPSPCRHSAPTS